MAHGADAHGIGHVGDVTPRHFRFFPLLHFYRLLFAEFKGI
jgi:hypothetical protein